jgi:hypothetical protein
MTRAIRFLGIGVVQAALLVAAFGLGRAMATPTIAAQPVLDARPMSTATTHFGCGITGDLVGDANPAEVARALCK